MPLLLQVKLDDYLAVLKATRVGKKLGKRNIGRERVQFYFLDSQLCIRVLDVVHNIAAQGHWEGTVSIPLQTYMFLRNAHPTQDPLTIAFDSDGGKLQIGTMVLKGEWALMTPGQ